MSATWFKSTASAVVLSAALMTPAMMVPAAASGLTAHLNTGTVAMGDTFQLTLSSSGSSSGAISTPDLSPLQKDFEILGTTQSSSSTIINGRASQTLSWILTLPPRAKGTFKIPAIAAGSLSSAPAEIKVVDASALPKTQGTNGVSVTSKLEGGKHFLFQEIPLTVRVEASVPLGQAELIVPHSEDFDLEADGDGTVSQLNRGGKPVTVVERKFMLRPQKDGAIEVPPFVLRGTVQDPNARRNDPFADFGFGRLPNLGSSLFSSFMEPGKPFTARSDAIKMQVAAKPGHKSAGTDWFLPAKVVKLKAEWDPANPVFREGEAVTRRISLIALGTRPEQLPELSFANPDGAKIYVDDTETGTAHTDQGTVAQRDTFLSIVPTRGGDITLPEVKVSWTDSATGEEREAVLPSEVIHAEGTAMAPPPQADASQPAPAQTAQTAQIAGAPPPLKTGAGSLERWQLWAGAGALVLVLAVTAAGTLVIRSRRNAVAKGPASSRSAGSGSQPHKVQPSPRSRQTAELRKAEDLARSGDLQASYGALLNWRRLAGGPSALPQKANRTIEDFGRLAYGGEAGASSEEAGRLIAGLRKDSHKTDEKPGGKAGDGLRLPDLYPA